MGSTNPIAGSGAQSGAVNNNAQSTAASINKSIGKDEFLKLLVAQLQNQDPTSPLKNEEFVAQLATFSSLEQLVAIRDGINTLVGMTGSTTP